MPGYGSDLHHVVEGVGLVSLGRLRLRRLGLLAVGHVAGHAEASVELLHSELLVELVEFAHQLVLVEVAVVVAAHHLLDLFHVRHHVRHVVEQVLHLVHVELFHHGLLLSVRLAKRRHL